MNFLNQLVEFFSDIFYTDNWPARWHCGKWTDFHGWLYIASDLMIWAAYFAIPFLLFRMLTKRTDLPFPKVFGLFIAFILLCGSTHLIDAIIFWWPAYRLSALIRLATGVVSIATVYALYKISPLVLTLRTAKQLEEEIEQRKEAEQIAQARFEENERILESSVDIICTIRKSGEFNNISKACERILGYNPSELIGKQFIDFVHPEDVEKTKQTDKLLFKGNATNEFINRYKRRDGKWTYISWNCSLSSDGELVYCVARDISHRIKSEQLKESLNRQLVEKIKQLQEQDRTLEKIKEFQFLAETLPQIIWTAKPDGTLDYFNNQWVEFTGMTSNDSKNWREQILHPEDLENYREVWAESLRTGNPYEIEYRFRRASDGIYKWHLGRAIAMRNEQGEIVKWFGSCTDIDVYKKALDLETKISQFEDFNRIVAHNLRGPAGSIETIIGILEEAESAEERAEFMGMLKGSSVSLNETLNELMKVLEIRFNQNHNFDTCYLPEVIKSVEAMLTGQIVTKQASIITDFQRLQIEFPKIYLDSIFYNMISNSLKYTRVGVPPVIHVRSRFDYGRVILEFEDNGLGIDLDEHGPNMFKLNKVFHRGFDSKGVGLFMTKTQIETFGGSISVESQVGVGTKFIIKL